MFSKILIANRGEIACRVIDTARAMNIRTVAVYSDVDKNALHVAQADEAVHIGPAAAVESYLVGARIIAAAIQTGAEAIHPGYGFLSENPDFVEAVEAAGLVFIGPSADAIRKMGLKDAAKTLMEEAGVPVVPGYHGANQDLAFLAKEAGKIGYPVLIKVRAGGGGKGMRKVDSANDFSSALESAQREGKASFGDGHVLIEKYITAPRHIEVQVFGDTHGNVIHLFERDCSLQRRHQKVIEEAPAPGMTDAMRDAMTTAAVTAAKSISYSGAGTVEFIVDCSGPLDPEKFWFMEMNTRLQVEHPVTEAIANNDLVEWQLRVAAGEALPETQDQQRISAHAMECRLYAEDVPGGFLPATGTLEHLVFGDDDDYVRIDTGVVQGHSISPWYDPMIAKIIVVGNDRDEARSRMQHALATTHVAGTVTNIAFLSALCAHDGFSQGNVDTGLIERDLESLTRVKDLPDEAIAFAAVAALDLDFAIAHTGWRMWGDASHRIRLLHGAEPVDGRVTISGYRRMSLDGTPVRLADIRRRETTITATIGEQTIAADVVSFTSRQGQRFVSVLFDGDTWSFEVPDALAGRDATASDPDAITAPMTGVVRSLEAKTGQTVSKGDRLVILEAMKMEHALTAPRDGTIADVFCKEGDQVDGGKTLIALIAETT